MSSFFSHLVYELDLKVNHGGKIIFADNLAKLDQYALHTGKYAKKETEMLKPKVVADGESKVVILKTPSHCSGKRI